MRRRYSSLARPLTPLRTRIERGYGGRRLLAVWLWCFLLSPSREGRLLVRLCSWLFTAFSLHSEKIFQGWWLLCVPRQSRSCLRSAPATALVLDFLASALHLIGICLGTMVRKRGSLDGVQPGTHTKRRGDGRRNLNVLWLWRLPFSGRRLGLRGGRCSTLLQTPLVEQGSWLQQGEKEAETADLFPFVSWRRTCQLGTCRVLRSQAPWRRPAGRAPSASRLGKTTFPGCVVEEIPWPGDLQATGAEKIVNAETVKRCRGSLRLALVKLWN
jgi:hypothetical protein